MRSALMRTSVALTGIMLVATVSLGGCGSDRGGDGRSVQGSQSSDLTEVGSLTAAGVTVTFYSYSAGGKPHIGVREEGSAFAKSSPVAALVAQRLTSQEIYLALAPEGATAPAPLVAVQADEAAALGRSAEVQQVTIDKNAVIEKDLVACQNWFLSFTPPAGQHWALGSRGTFTTGGREFISPTPNEVIFGGCNESSVPVNLMATVYETWNNNIPGSVLVATMNAYQYLGWWWTAYGYQSCGFGSCIVGASYELDASTNNNAWSSFDLVTGTAVSPPPR